MATANNFAAKTGLSVGTRTVANNLGYWTGSPVDVLYGGTSANNAAAALTNLGALPVAGGTISGNLTVAANTSVGTNSSNTLTIIGRTVAAPNGLNIGGNIGINTNPTLSLTINATDAIQLPVGTIAQRPSAANGLIRYNSSNSVFEGYSVSGWGPIAPSATGNGGDQIFWLNGKNITSDYVLPTDRNAGTFGPVTVNAGVTVTVPDGATWIIV